MRPRHAILALSAVLAVALLATAGATAARQPDVVQPHLRALGREPAFAHLRHFLHSLRARDHVSSDGYRALVAKRRRLNSAATHALEVRDRARTRFLKRYLAKRRPRHRSRIARTSTRYYSYLRSLEGYRVRQILAEISDELDRLAYS
jgi:hypothetical protein